MSESKRKFTLNRFALQYLRDLHGETLLEQGRRLGLTSVEVSDVSNGRIPDGAEDLAFRVVDGYGADQAKWAYDGAEWKLDLVSSDERSRRVAVLRDAVDRLTQGAGR